MEQATVAMRVEQAHPQGRNRIGPREIAAQIRKLEDIRERNRFLSAANTRIEVFYRYLDSFKGRDQYLAIVPQGAIAVPGEKSRGFVKCVTAEIAADLLAFADARAHRVRLATPQEIAAQQAYEAANTAAAQQTIANRQAELARAQIMALLGGGIPAVGGGAPSPAPLQPPMALVEAKEPEPFEVEIPATPASVSAAVAGTDVPPQPTVVFDEGLKDLASEKLVESLVEAGFHDVRAIAEASPADLQKVKGIGASRAAQMIASANEMLKARDPETPTV